MVVLLSSAGLPFRGASVELDLAAKLTVIYGLGSPHKGYLGASLNTQVKGSGYTWEPAEASIRGSAVCHSVPVCALSTVTVCLQPVIMWGAAS